LSAVTNLIIRPPLRKYHNGKDLDGIDTALYKAVPQSGVHVKWDIEPKTGEPQSDCLATALRN
jgi:hypothetical protein